MTHRLILDTLPFIRRQAGSFAMRFREDFDDLYNEGVIGALKAARKFDPSRGVSFEGYAGPWVREQMRDYCFRNRSLLSATRPTQEKIHRELDARKLGVRVEPLTWTSQHATVRQGKASDGEDRGLWTIDPEQESIACLLSDMRLLKRAVLELPADDAEFVTRRYMSGTDEPVSHTEIAAERGLSRQRVQQLDTRAIDGLKDAIKRITRRQAA
jgi:RNA polymerase sigma-32 factor